MTVKIDLQSRVAEIQRVYNKIVEDHIGEGMVVFSGAIFALSEALGRWYKEQTGEDPRDKMRDYIERKESYVRDGKGKPGVN